jgi:hypothetical protein
MFKSTSVQLLGDTQMPEIECSKFLNVPIEVNIGGV